MKCSRKLSLALAVVGVSVVTTTLKADFILTTSIAFSGNTSIYVMSALNNGLNGTGTKLVSIDAILTTRGVTPTSAIKVNNIDIDGDGIADPNPLGLGLDFGSTVDTFFRVGSYGSFSGAATPPNILQPGMTYPPGYSPSAEYANLHSLEVTGSNTSGGVAANNTGAPFANIVARAGVSYTLIVVVSGDSGAPQPFALQTSGPDLPPIISLTAVSTGNPFGFGNNVGTLNVAGSNGTYSLAQLSGLNENRGFAEARTFTPGTDPEIFGLDVQVDGTQATAADIATLVDNINLNSWAGAAPIASSISPSATFPSNYNLFLTYTVPPSGDNYLGFDLADQPYVPNATVAAIAVVPEPASVALLLLSSSAVFVARRPKSS